MGSELDYVQSVWETLAHHDPLWAILSIPAKKGGKWDIAEFFREGSVEVDKVLATLAETGHPVPHRGSALDFGCGVGRLSQRLADYFDRVVGVDISLNMLDLARQFNRHGSKVEYVHNGAPTLARFDDASFDFLYSNIVLQHMEPRHAIGYIHEFFRVVRAGGFIVFQIPSHLTDEYLPHDYSRDPLPAQVCRAKIVPLPPSHTPAAGSGFEIPVQVTNLSRADWTQHPVYQLNVGNHWLSPNGKKTIAHDDGRMRLPGRIRCGETVTVVLGVKAPDKPGPYLLEIDIVQEAVRWFKQAGSATARVPVNIGPAGAPVQHVTTASALPDFLMNGVPKSEILALISDAGGTLITIEEYITEWYAYKYFVRR